jgi:hypothetical protein
MKPAAVYTSGRSFPGRRNRRSEQSFAERHDDVVIVENQPEREALATRFRELAQAREVRHPDARLCFTWRLRERETLHTGNEERADQLVCAHNNNKDASMLRQAAARTPAFSASPLFPLILMLFLAACGGGGGDGGGSTGGGTTGGGASGNGGGGSPPPTQTPQYSAGGAVTGLAGSGLVLQLNASGDLSITANGSFTFPSQMSSGSSFAITIKTQPTSPLQSCVVVGGTGTIADANAVATQINCTTLYGISGTVVGLGGHGLGLRLNGEPDLAISANGGFTFPTHLPAGSLYTVVASTQPSSQSCTVTSGTGTIQGADANGIQVVCADVYRVGGTVTGALSAGLVLRLSDGDLPVDANGSFAFPEAIVAGTPYQLTVRSSPAGQSCSVTNGSGVVSSASLTSINVSCSFPVALAYAPKQLRLSWGAVDGALAYRVLSAPGISGSFSQIQSLPAAATVAVLDVGLPEFESPQGAYRVEVCTAAGCLTSNDVITTAAGMLQSIGYMKASNAGFKDAFSAVALSEDGQTLAVGAPGESSDADRINGNQSDDSAPNAGAVYVFRNNGPAGWVQEAYIKPDNSVAGQLFGSSISVSGDGDTLAVGAWGESAATGAVFVFTRSGSDWEQQAHLKASNAEAGDEFGRAVSVSADGDWLAVGAPWEASNATGINGDQTNNSFNSAGAAYAFHRAAGAWTQQSYIKPAVSNLGAQFGGALALSGDASTLVVGATIESGASTGINGNPYDQSQQLSGAAYVFSLAGNAWSQQAYVKASDTAQRDLFGASVALSHDGNTVAVGAAGEDGWPGGDPDVIEGAVYVFTRVAGNWSQQQKLKGLDPGDMDAFGCAVALDAAGTTLLVGASGEASDQPGVGGQPTNNLAAGAGAAFLFRLENGVWDDPVYLKAPNPEGGDPIISADRFGTNVALSADAQTLAIGAPGEDGPPEQEANDSGAVYLY